MQPNADYKKENSQIPSEENGFDEAFIQELYKHTDQQTGTFDVSLLQYGDDSDVKRIHENQYSWMEELKTSGIVETYECSSAYETHQEDPPQNDSSLPEPYEPTDPIDPSDFFYEGFCIRVHGMIDVTKLSSLREKMMNERKKHCEELAKEINELLMLIKAYSKNPVRIEEKLNSQYLRMMLRIEQHLHGRLIPSSLKKSFQRPFLNLFSAGQEMSVKKTNLGEICNRLSAYLGDIHQCIFLDELATNTHAHFEPIKTIEFREDTNDEDVFYFIVNGETIHSVSKRQNWADFFKIAENVSIQTFETANNLVTYFNSESRNPLYARLKYRKTRLLIRRGKLIQSDPHVSISVIESRTWDTKAQSLKKSSS